ncbi:hypothetical protein DdX_06080 [Ditylenchus destructor]|uniref:Uncharacterized protein n=1 Tax=Ditylenchus destructor TaxID=166010 RepID=A0AAD4NBM8_9BILA|nr:hypothetical protein DdX_06080 [Ditylenchus destructor]
MFIIRQINTRTSVYIVLGVLAVVLVFQLGANIGSRRVIAPRGTHERDFYLRREAERVHPVKVAPKPQPDDEHMKMLDESRKLTPSSAKGTPYSPRVNMGACPKIFGNVIVFVAVVESSYKTHYRVAQQSLECYLKTTNYTFKLVDLDHDERVNRHCKHDQLFFKKHCAASVYLQDADWMLVLDADAGVVNPNHCIEEWIDDRVDLIFYERFFNWEIASGNYLVKNTEFARNFLMKWADWQYIQPSNWNGADNGVLQIHILQTVLPDAKAEIKACDSIWHRGTGYETYMAYVTCVKTTLGANRLFPGKLRILRRGHGWVRDGYITSDAWSERDFMLHGWKLQEINLQGWNSPFSKMFNLTECGQAYSGWYWRNEKRIGIESIRVQFANFERSVGKTFPKEARIHPYLQEPDIGDCYPHCDDYT